MSFHFYRINEIYSNASGTLQFIELAVGAVNGESFWSGVTLSATANGLTHRYTFATDLPSTATANTTVLIATQAFAELAQASPNYIIPDGFLFQSGGLLNFGSADVLGYPSLPTDGASSLDRLGVPAAATPKNFAGSVGVLPRNLVGSAGDDTLGGTAQPELIEGLAGNDTLRSGGGGDLLLAGGGDDAVFSGTGNDRLDGGDGYDYLYFTDAGAGVTIDMRSGLASGGAGSDRFAGFELFFGSNFNDTFIGSDRPANFLGLDGNDTMTGGAGRDRFEGNGGDDTIDGGEGVDAAAYYSAAFAVDVNLATGRASGGLGNDTLRNIEDAIGSVFNDRLTGSNVDNRLEGSDGNDTFVGSAGDDTLQGDAGIDTAIYPLTRSAYTLRRGSDGVMNIEKPGAAGTDALPTLERLQFSDTRVAIDLAGAAGQTAKLIGAVFGAGSVSNKEYVGIGLGYLDGGMSYEALAALAVAAIGVTRHADVVNLLWSNLFGSAPTAAQAAPYVAMLDGGTTIGALTVLAAETSVNTDRIGLVGLTATGIEYAL